MPNYLSLKDFLLIAEAVLRRPYDELEQAVCVFRAQTALAAPFARVYGALLHPDPVEQAAICAIRLVRTRPLPVGNEDVAYECMREMLVRSGCHWSRPEEDAEEIADTLKGLAAGTIGEAEFIRWVRLRVVIL